MEFDNQHIIRLSTIDSTNSQAWRMIQNGDNLDGYVIQSDYQESGKGHMGAYWESKPGQNLLLSFVCKPSMVEPSNQFVITKAISLAMQQALEAITPGHHVHIKWPNDLYTGGKKMGGILIECSIQGSKIDYCVAGVGLNINQMVFTSDAPNPVSCRLLTGIKHDLDHCRQVVISQMNLWLSMLKNRQFKQIDEAYLNHLLGYNRRMPFMEKSRRFTARIAGVDKYGRLILEEDRQSRAYDMKEVRLIPDS